MISKRGKFCHCGKREALRDEFGCFLMVNLMFLRCHKNTECGSYEQTFGIGQCSSVTLTGQQSSLKEMVATTTAATNRVR